MAVQGSNQENKDKSIPTGIMGDSVERSPQSPAQGLRVFRHLCLRAAPEADNPAGTCGPGGWRKASGGGEVEGIRAGDTGRAPAVSALIWDHVLGFVPASRPKASLLCEPLTVPPGAWKTEVECQSHAAVG